MLYHGGLGGGRQSKFRPEACGPAGEARRNVHWQPANAVRTRPMPKQPHVGEVSAICYIPGMEHMFMTAGMDGRVRLWNSNAQEVAMVEPFGTGTTCLSVCAHKPSAFAVRLPHFACTGRKHQCDNLSDARCCRWRLKEDSCPCST